VAKGRAPCTEGAKAFYIFGPSTRKLERENEETGEKEEKVIITGFQVIPVFPILCEVVTDETFGEIGMIERWKTLSRYSDNFQMIILQKSFTKIKELAKSNGINVNKYWYSKICDY
jgi:hypothetical protein